MYRVTEREGCSKRNTLLKQRWWRYSLTTVEDNKIKAAQASPEDEQPALEDNGTVLSSWAAG